MTLLSADRSCEPPEKQNAEFIIRGSRRRCTAQHRTAQRSHCGWVRYARGHRERTTNTYILTNARNLKTEETNQRLHRPTAKGNHPVSLPIDLPNHNTRKQTHLRPAAPQHGLRAQRPALGVPKDVVHEIHHGLRVRHPLGHHQGCRLGKSKSRTLL